MELDLHVLTPFIVTTALALAVGAAVQANAARRIPIRIRRRDRRHGRRS